MTARYRLRVYLAERRALAAWCHRMGIPAWPWESNMARRERVADWLAGKGRARIGVRQ